MSGLFGSGGDSGIQAQLEAQKRAQTQALASATNTEAATDQQLAMPRRKSGGRNLLQYLQGGTTLGG